MEIKKVKEARDIQVGIKRLADKGGGIVIQTKDAYKAELEMQLEDLITYFQLKSNPTSLFLYKGMKKGILNTKEGRYFFPDLCRIPVIYTVPKIHKNNQNPPGRPKCFITVP